MTPDHPVPAPDPPLLPPRPEGLLVVVAPPEALLPPLFEARFFTPPKLLLKLPEALLRDEPFFLYPDP